MKKECPRRKQGKSLRIPPPQQIPSWKPQQGQGSGQNQRSQPPVRAPPQQPHNQQQKAELQCFSCKKLGHPGKFCSLLNLDRPSHLLSQQNHVWGFQQSQEFERGLKPGVRGKVVPFCYDTYARVVQTAQVIEADWESGQKARDQANKAKRLKVEPPSRKNGIPLKNRQCFNCNKYGHLSKDCPRKNSDGPQRPQPQQQNPAWRSPPPSPQRTQGQVHNLIVTEAEVKPGEDVIENDPEDDFEDDFLES